MTKSVYDQLIAAGVDPRDIHHHESDLYVKVTDESTAWLEGYEFKGNATRFMDAVDHVPSYEVPFAFLDDVVAAKEGESPSPDDIGTLAQAGVFRCDADVRDEGDVPFAGEWLTVERAEYDDPDDADRRRARAFCYFEPKSVGGAAPSWNCCVEMEGDFLSHDGTWPDSFGDAHGAVGCLIGYFCEGGLLEERGWKVVGR